MTLVEQILDGARDHIARGQIEDAVGLLENAVALVQHYPQSDSSEAPRILRDLSSLVEAGSEFWAGWAQLVSPDAGLYGADGGVAPVPAVTALRIAVRG